MHNYLITKGTTDVSVELRIVDSTDGTPETGVVWNTAGIDLQYRRDGAASTAITEATLAALTTAHTDGGFLHIGNGVYRFDLPDAACAAGVDKVVVHGTVTGMVVIGCVIQLTDMDVFDATLWTALSNQYDGTTGLIGDTYPATQAQLSGLSVSSAAQSVRVKASPDGFVLTTGSEVNTEDSTVALDGVRHELSDAAGTLDCYYKFDISSGAVPVSATFKAVVNGGNDVFGIYANIGSSTVPVWSQRLSITGTGTATNDIYPVDLYSSDTVTDIPTEVWLRVYGTGLTTSSFDTDQMFVSRSFDFQYSGYDNGAVWINTVGGTAGTILGYNGIASRPVDTLADALTIGNSLALHRYEISNDSSITLASATTDKILAGRGWTLALGGQDLTNTHILDAKASGIATGSSIEFHDSLLTNVTSPGGSFHDCAVVGTFTCNAAATYHFHQSHSGDGSIPIIDLGAAVGATTILMHNWKGSVVIDNLGATGADVINLAGDGEITLNASCVGGTLNYQGNWKLTNNGSGITINADDNSANLVAILADTAEIGVAGAGLTSIMTTQLTESYAADGAAPTPAQALMLIQQMLGDFSISGTTLTVKQVDGTTTAGTFTLDDGTTPTSITRTT